MFFVSVFQSECVFIPMCAIQFFRGYHKLIVRVRRDTSFYCLILFDLGIFQVLLYVQKLEKLENLPIFGFCLYL